MQNSDDSREIENSVETNQTAVQLFEQTVNNFLSQYGHLIPYPHVIGFLELKAIELKESYRFTVESNLRQNAGVDDGHPTH